MAWTTPMTAVANAPLTSATFNAQIRDNMRCQAPYLTGTAGDVYVVQSANTIVSRTIQYAEVLTKQTTSSTSFVDLATPGPSITVDMVYGQQAMVWVSAELDNTTADAQSVAAVDVSGASTYSATSQRCAVIRDGNAANSPCQYMASYLFDPLTRGGSLTFEVQYRVGSGTGSFANRRLMVWPL